MIKIGINGFGRIGRFVFRSTCEAENAKEVQVVAINDLCPVDYMAYMLKYDTMHGRFNGTVEADVEKNELIVNGNHIRVTAERDPENLKWDEVGAEYVVESTGLFLAYDKAEKHLKAGAKYVVLSAPSKADANGNQADMFVCGVNTDKYNGQKIVSNASCTTNCLAPMAYALNKYAAIQSGIMSTIHAYTGDQMILDGPQRKGDLRRSRAGAQNIVPNSTGAAKAIGIFFIVIGHVFHDQGIYAQYVYSFHVPLFFFLTGVTFSRGKNGSWKFLIQKLTRLLVPFYIFAAVSWGAYAILGKFVSSFAEKAIDSSVPAIIISTLKGYCAVNTPLWFLPCLFLELLFLYAITFIIDRIASKRRLSYALFGISIISAIVIQYVIYKFSLFPTKAPIFKADVAIAMLPFSLSGVLFSKFAAQNQKTLRKPYIFILSLLCVAAGGFSALKLNIRAW